MIVTCLRVTYLNLSQLNLETTLVFLSYDYSPFFISFLVGRTLISKSNVLNKSGPDIIASIHASRFVFRVTSYEIFGFELACARS